MKMNKLVILLVLLGLGCNTNKTSINGVRLTSTTDRSSIKLSGMDYLVLQDIGRDSSGVAWQSLMPVYKMPADTDLKNYQPVQPGTYAIKDSAVVFTPDTPFAAGQTYFLRYYKFDAASKPTDFITGHNKLGSLHYTDLIFKQ
jgi:hypothetical protein